MKIVLINVSGIGNDGARLISALLKRAGHSVKSIFWPKNITNVNAKSEIGQLDILLKNSDLVMIAVYSHHANKAVMITEYIRKKYPRMKVIWGGPHCVSAPDLSLQYADGVCFAEGDNAVVELVSKMASGQDYTKTSNMAFNVNGEYVKNSVLPPTSDLSSLPYPDYDVDDQFVLDDGLYQMTKERMQKYFPRYPFGKPTLWVLTARGCPYTCTFCNNIRYISMYGRNPMRFRSVDHFMGELEFIFKKFDFFGYVGLGDDDFLMRPIGDLEDFADKYKSKIGLPFIIEVSAPTYRKEKLEILLDSGLKIIQIGVQSGSQRILDEVFKRSINVHKTKEVVSQLEPYQKKYGLQLLLDFIIDNPYETQADIIQTYQYIINIPVPARINLFVLVFFPGSPIYERALKDGFIEPYSDKTFRNYVASNSGITYQQNYETLLVLLMRHRRLRSLPKFILQALGGSFIRSIASFLPKRILGLLIDFILNVKK